MKGMESWSKASGFKILKSVYFMETQIKDTVNLQPALGDCVAVYSSSGKGKIPVVCMSTDPRLKETIKAQEAARRALEKKSLIWKRVGSYPQTTGGREDALAITSSTESLGTAINDENIYSSAMDIVRWEV